MTFHSVVHTRGPRLIVSDRMYQPSAVRSMFASTVMTPKPLVLTTTPTPQKAPSRCLATNIHGMAEREYHVVVTASLCMCDNPSSRTCLASASTTNAAQKTLARCTCPPATARATAHHRPSLAWCERQRPSHQTRIHHGLAVEFRKQRGRHYSVPQNSATELRRLVSAPSVSEQVHLQFAGQNGYETVDEAPDLSLPWLWDVTEPTLAHADQDLPRPIVVRPRDGVQQRFRVPWTCVLSWPKMR